MVVPHRPDDRGELRHLRLGEARGRLVHQHEPRLGRQRPRDAEPPLVAVGERPAPAARPAPRARAGSSSSSARCRASPGPRSDAERRDLDVLAHRQPAERAAVLERPREPGARRAGAALQRVIVAGPRARRCPRSGSRTRSGRSRASTCRRRSGPIRPTTSCRCSSSVTSWSALDAREGPRDGGGPECSSGPPLRS